MSVSRCSPPGLGNLLSLARRAGKLILGLDDSRHLLKKGRPLLILADPALSARSLRELERLPEAHSGVRVVLLEDFQQTLGFLGKQAVRVVAVSDPGFRQGMLRLLAE